MRSYILLWKSAATRIVSLNEIIASPLAFQSAHDINRDSEILHWFGCQAHFSKGVSPPRGEVALAPEGADRQNAGAGSRHDAASRLPKARTTHA